MGSFKKRKKTPITELNIFLSKIFSTENSNGYKGYGYRKNFWKVTPPWTSGYV